MSQKSYRNQRMRCNNEINNKSCTSNDKKHGLHSYSLFVIGKNSWFKECEDRKKILTVQIYDL